MTLDPLKVGNTATIAVVGGEGALRRLRRLYRLLRRRLWPGNAPFPG